MAKSKLKNLKKIKKSKKCYRRIVFNTLREGSEIVPVLDSKIIELIHSHPIWTSRGSFGGLK
jgi:hypothetical protein